MIHLVIHSVSRVLLSLDLVLVLVLALNLVTILVIIPVLLTVVLVHAVIGSSFDVGSGSFLLFFSLALVWFLLYVQQ